LATVTISWLQYRELRAPAALLGDVACVWYDDRAQSHPVLPDGCIDIVWFRGSPPFVAGPMTQPIMASAASFTLGMRFRPGHATSFLQRNLPADMLLNVDVPLSELWRDGSAERLWHDLEATSTAEQAVMLLSNAVVKQRVTESDPLVSAAVRHLHRRPAAPVSELGDKLGVSERQLLRRFTQAVGYGPKVLGRVLRFQRFMSLLTNPRATNWDLATLAAESGYADHAHLTRECARLAGQVPSLLRLI
jgi:AraC-like DNA-binding protein